MGRGIVNQFKTSTETMAAAASHVNDVNAQVASLLSALRAEVATAPSHFHGDAARTFAALMADYDRNAQALGNALRGIAEEIASAGKSYAATDESEAAALRASGSGLNV